MSETPRTDAYYEKWQESWSREPINLDLCRQLERELAEARKQCDTLAKALSMYGLPYTDDDLEHMAQNPSPYTHEAKRELIRRKALAAVKGGKHECNH